jgi:uncharacterized membrane protein YeiH
MRSGVNEYNRLSFHFADMNLPIPNLPISKIPIDTLFSVVDFLAVFVGGLGGALAAVRDMRYKYDLVGVMGLALASALGGGITRDLILQKGPPLAFADARYLMAALAGAVIGMIFAQKIGKNTERAIVIFDAAALGLFSVSGSTRAINAGMSRLPALLLGATTAVGGGCIRDVLSGRTPKIFERGELYAIAAGFGAATFLLCDRLGYRVKSQPPWAACAALG